MKDPLEPITMSVEFQAVDPDVLRLLYGGEAHTLPASTFAVEVWTPVKRTFWRWLTRRPWQYRYTLVPNTRVSGNTTEKE